jgi:hypothetical protein
MGLVAGEYLAALDRRLVRSDRISFLSQNALTVGKSLENSIV